jgi:XTP/dITP diphosphohydrolase
MSFSDRPGDALLELVAVMDRLRRECPWDQEQTHESLAPYLLEEAHEVIEALDAQDRSGLREELGDLLLQVLFHARIAAEHPEEPWGLDAVAADARDKMVRRHPHVFAGRSVDGADEVAANWEELKAVEKSRASVLDGVPPTLPALARAEKMLGRLERAGHGLGSGARPVDEDRSAADREIGDRLLAEVVAARAAGVDPEGALRRTLRDLEAAVRASE